MKHFRYWIISLLMLAILAACSSTPTPTPEPEQIPVTVVVTATPDSAQAVVDDAAMAEEEATPEPEAIVGPLTVLCGMQEEWCQAAVAAFEAETGVETSMVRMSSGEALARLKAEGEDTLFDVWYGGPASAPVQQFRTV